MSPFHANTSATTCVDILQDLRGLVETAVARILEKYLKSMFLRYPVHYKQSGVAEMCRLSIWIS